MEGALNVHLDQLSYLREAARAQSWSQAARTLRMSQPALSQSLRELERRVGVPLFERQGRTMTLTPVGHEVVSFAERLLVQADRMNGRLEALRRGEVGLLRVGMIDAACLYALPDAIRKHRERWPEVDLRLTVAGSGVLLERLRDYELDVAVVVGPVGGDDLTSQTLLHEKLWVVRPRRDRRSLEEATMDTPAPWVLYPATSHTRRAIDAALARARIEPHVTLESGNPQVLRQMIAMGLGWSVLPEAVVDEDRRGIALAGDEPLAHREICVVRRRAAPADPRVAHLVDLFVEEGIR